MSTKLRPVEHPTRLHDFLAGSKDLGWSQEKRDESLDKLFIAVNTLAHAEVDYYYRQRRSARVKSYWLRGAAWVFGTLGFIAPLVAAALGGSAAPLASWGYVSLGIAASALTGNALFDGSAGHARNVKTQLELERLITVFRLEWFAHRASMAPGSTDEQLAIAFKLLVAFGGALYSTIGAETTEWDVAIAKVNSQFEQRVTSSLPAALTMSRS